MEHPRKAVSINSLDSLKQPCGVKHGHEQPIQKSDSEDSHSKCEVLEIPLQLISLIFSLSCMQKIHMTFFFYVGKAKTLLSLI